VVAQEVQKRCTVHIFKMVAEASCLLYGRQRSEGENNQKEKNDNIESKKHKPEKGAVHNVTREPAPKCVVYHGPHQVTSCKNWGETSIANR